jgi:hypothetical protein
MKIALEKAMKTPLEKAMKIALEKAMKIALEKAMKIALEKEMKTQVMPNVPLIKVWYVGTGDLDGRSLLPRVLLLLRVALRYIPCIPALRMLRKSQVRARTLS